MITLPNPTKNKTLFPNPTHFSSKGFNPVTKKMIQLLYTVILTEAATIIVLLFKTPLRKFIISGVDKIKRGNRAPIVVKTVSATIFVILSSSIFSLINLARVPDVHDGVSADLNPAEQLLFAQHLLQSCLMGFILFLALMIDRLHHYIRELRLRRKTVEGIKKTDKKIAVFEEIKAREMLVETFKNRIKQMESELHGKIKEASSSEATVEALRKQSEGLLLEYDRLSAENQELRNQLQVLDRRVSRSASKKNS